MQTFSMVFRYLSPFTYNSLKLWCTCCFIWYLFRQNLILSPLGISLNKSPIIIVGAFEAWFSKLWHKAMSTCYYVYLCYIILHAINSSINCYCVLALIETHNNTPSYLGISMVLFGKRIWRIVLAQVVADVFMNCQNNLG